MDILLLLFCVGCFFFILFFICVCMCIQRYRYIDIYLSLLLVYIMQHCIMKFFYFFYFYGYFWIYWLIYDPTLSHDQKMWAVTGKKKKRWVIQVVELKLGCDARSFRNLVRDAAAPHYEEELRWIENQDQEILSEPTQVMCFKHALPSINPRAV